MSGDYSTTNPTAKMTTATVTVNHGTTVIVTSIFAAAPIITSPTNYPEAETTKGPSSQGASTAIGLPNQSVVDTSEPQSSFWDSTGKVVAVFVAIGALIIAMVIALVWFCSRKKRRRDEETRQGSPGALTGAVTADKDISRSTSLLQLLGRRETLRTEKPGFTYRNYEENKPSETRVPMVDQRLDPQSMMIRFEDNTSHTSFRDEEDYSRRIWRVTNATDSDSQHSTERRM